MRQDRSGETNKVSNKAMRPRAQGRKRFASRNRKAKVAIKELDGESDNQSRAAAREQGTRSSEGGGRTARRESRAASGRDGGREGGGIAVAVSRWRAS